MVEQFLGEIKLVGFNFAPFGWAQASGQILPISSNTALFSLLGVNFGGNGTSNFGLPNLQSRVIVGAGSGPNGTFDIGEQAGSESETLSLGEYPSHTHAFNVYNTFGQAGQPGSTHFLSATRANAPPPPPPPVAGPNLYGAATSLTQLNVNVLSLYSGGSLPHENRQAFLAMTYCIALQGVFPARG